MSIENLAKDLGVSVQTAEAILKHYVLQIIAYEASQSPTQNGFDRIYALAKNALNAHKG